MSLVPMNLHCVLRFTFAILLATLSVGSLTRTTSAQDATPASEASPVPLEGDSAEIPALLASCDSIFGVVIIDAMDRIVFERNADVPFVSASLYKLVLLAETFTRLESGELALDQTVEIFPEYFGDGNGEDSYFSYDVIGQEITLEELIYSSGSYSSNVGAGGLLSLTSFDRLDQFAQELGLTSTRYRVGSDQIGDLYPGADGGTGLEDLARSVAFVGSFAGSTQVNITTPRDMATFFRLLRDDQLGSPLVSWRMKSVLTPKVITDRLPALLPIDANVIHKTGNLEGVLHDAGIIESAEGSVIVVAMAQAVTDLDQTFAVEQRLGLFGYKLTFDQAPPDRQPATPTS